MCIRDSNGTDYTYYGPADCEIKENADGTVDYNFKMREAVSYTHLNAASYGLQHFCAILGILAEEKP